MTIEAAPPDGPGEFEQRLALHAPGVAAALRRLLGNPERVADALQQALMKAWQARGSYDGARPFGPWLRTIAVRVARDQRRADSRRPDQAPLEVDLPATAGAPDAQAEVDDEVARLRRELARLPEMTRRTFIMFYDEEEPVAVIAAMLAIPVNTVKTHLHRARRELARRLRVTERNA